MDNLKFGKFIKELRKEKNMTQKDLAEKLNLTDKAISKWERGLSFPDITMLNSIAEIFEVKVSEILNGERGKEEKVDMEKAIKEAVDKVTKKQEKRERTIRKVKKVVRILASIAFISGFLLQIGYIFILKKHGFEYAIDSMNYLINEIIIIAGLLIVLFLVKKNKIRNRMAYLICVIATIINIVFMINNGFENKCIISFSSDFSSELVLKQNTKTGNTTFYEDKFILFAREKESFNYEVSGKIKTQWLTNDICSITYQDREDKLREFVATYGDRGNGISYYYATNTIMGEWQTFTQYGNSTRLIADSKGITIQIGEEKELFEYSNCKQYGTTAIVLYKQDTPQYVIALNEECKIDEDTGIIEQNGTITLCEIDMEKTIPKKMQCVNYKGNLENNTYNIVSLPTNSYTFKNGILYISYDGKKVIEVPGDFSKIDKYEENTYQITEEKTVFYDIRNQKNYLVYSDDMGNTWQTVELPNKSTIQNIHFINANLGFMLEFEDVAMGEAFGEISKTLDGGKTWQVISNGIGNENEQRFKRGSQIRFFDENLGFLTMPLATGESSDLYITQDGGTTFSKIAIEDNELQEKIYDDYQLPTKENGKLYLEISQGTDGDYNGGDSKIYYSDDNAMTWKIKQS